jgi:hypothetical protein
VRDYGMPPNMLRHAARASFPLPGGTCVNAGHHAANVPFPCDGATGDVLP